MKPCPKCGTLNRPTANFCKSCRSPLGGQAVAAAPAAPVPAGGTMCPIGHIYPANLPQCPYCPRPSDARAGGAAPTRQEVGGGGISSGKAAPTRPPMGDRPRPAPKATKIAKEDRPLAGWLVVLSSRTEEIYRDYRLYEGRNKIGRSSSGAAIGINDDEISGEHAVLTSEGDEYYITDVGSANGTYLNGQKVRDAPIADGDYVKIGKTVLVFRSFTNRAEM